MKDIKRWNPGRAEVEQMLDLGHLERVVADMDLAARLVEIAGQHLNTARSATESDPTGSLQIAYDGARKAMAAILQAQGLRPTSSGGHKALEEALGAQLGRKKECVKMFGQLRLQRNQSEYPSSAQMAITAEDAQYACDDTATIIKQCVQVVAIMPPFGS